jgi:predicted nucleic acid-binding protein
MPDVVDTSVLIPFFNRGSHRETVVRLLRRGTFVLCSVVAEEILAGTRGRQDRAEFEAFFMRFESSQVVTPVHQDWRTAGRLLSQYSQRHGQVDVRHHQNDILIALAASSVGASILTNNVSDMSTWTRMLGRRPRPRVRRPSS